MNLNSTYSPQIRTVLDNGLVVLVWENPAADIIAARIFVRAGSRWETPQQAGLSNLVAAVLTKGTEQFSSYEIADRVESVGASLSADAATDYFLLSLKTVSSDFEEILQLAGELLRSPSFPIQEIELERRLVLQAIRSQQEQPFTVAFDQLRQGMYRDHPYALSGLGTEDSIAQLTQEDFFRYHQTHFRPDNMVISLSGRVDSESAIALINQVFGDWQAPDTPLTSLTLPVITSEPTRIAIAQETQQSIVMLGYLAPAVGSREERAEGRGQRAEGSTQSSVLSPQSSVSIQNSHPTPHTPHPTPPFQDYAALKLLNSYLGNGLSSRLFVELREKRGLAYEVSAFYPTRLDPAQFVVYMGTAPDNTEIALEGLQTEVDRLRTEQLTPEELQSAKNKILGQYALGKQTNSQIAQIFGWYETLGLGIDFDRYFQEQIAAVTLELAQEAAFRYLTEPYAVLLGPEVAVKGLANLC
ncbi:insulinase family protein [Kovacikia minuta CCNUW1]|uniref:M16 family metallopeptidase n=1 Tax=Kovacikia minuta TaxID=2931930 RepID=UPI001CCF3FBD|nr:pitrilysin family protein [Kovacikia minuta]UBF26745.1 insulinase family protein [Kovacikia minuta CCNUW1]